MESEDIEFLKEIREHNLTMVSDYRLFSTAISCKYIIQNKIQGSFVECGVWRGGNAMVAAYMFKKYNFQSDIYLFDTFLGMTPPTEDDVEIVSGNSAILTFENSKKNNHNEWCYASLDEVKNNFVNFGLLNKNIKFIPGDVSETLLVESNLPTEISILRLDTDWFKSTLIELNILYPKLTKHGILMIDDYGYWSGAKKAVDSFFDTMSFRPFMHYIDQTGRLVIKP